MKKITILLNFIFIFITLSTSALYAESISNKQLRLNVDKKSGTFCLKDRLSGYEWRSDPWVESAGILSISDTQGHLINIDISTSQSIIIEKENPLKININFKDPLLADGTVCNGIEISTSLRLDDTTSDLYVNVLSVAVPEGYKKLTFEYPLRSFSLLTEQERGLAAIPYVEGVVVPSYIYPMRNSKFGVFDDTMYMERSTGTLSLYDDLGLSMPWFGMQSEESSMIALIPESGSVKMKYILNYNNRTSYNRTFNRESSYPRILSLYPQWDLKRFSADESVKFHIIPGGDYVDMTKYYREEAIESGKFVSLREKAKNAPNVNLMAGDIYIHLYGGYPHYVDHPQMQLNFNDVYDMLDDLHNNLNVERLWLNLWGVWENYPPEHLPYNKSAGGREGLKRVVDLAKEYNYNICTYYNWGCLLEHDPKYDYKLLETDSDNNYIFRNRWTQVDPELWTPKAKEVIDQVEREIGFNANYSDSGQTDELREYLSTLGVPVSQERKGATELSVKYWHRAEGMAPHNIKSSTIPFVEAPLFNLVYHDALMTTNRWQSPDNDYDLNGDYPVRSLRNMLYGNGVMYVVPPYEYPGIRPMIKQAVELMAPLHKETAFEELTSHEYLSDDMMVQKSTFANGVEVVVNMGLVEQNNIPGYGFEIKHSDGSTTSGGFQYSLIFNGN